MVVWHKKSNCTADFSFLFAHGLFCPICPHLRNWRFLPAGRVFQLIESTSCLLNAFLCTLWSARKNELRQCRKCYNGIKKKTNNMLPQSHVRFRFARKRAVSLTKTSEAKGKKRLQGHFQNLWKIREDQKFNLTEYFEFPVFL